MAWASPTCRCWRRSPDSAAGRMDRLSSRYWRASRRPGWCSCPDWPARRRWRSLHVRALGATRERMLRELVEAIDTLTAARPLVLVSRTCTGADHATLDLIAALARRQEPARLLVIGVYRPADARRDGHPLPALAHELRVRGRCVELALPALDAAATAAYLAARLPGPDGAGRPVGGAPRRTDGNPLFMGAVVDAWIADATLIQGGRRLGAAADPSALTARARRPPSVDRAAPGPTRRRGPGGPGGGQHRRHGVLGGGGGRPRPAGRGGRSPVRGPGAPGTVPARARRGRLARRDDRRPLGLPIRCIGRCCTTGRRRAAGRACTGQSASGWRSATAAASAHAAELAAHFVAGEKALERGAALPAPGGRGGVQRSAYREAIGI